MNGKQVIKKLEANGWSLARITGSHHIMHKGSAVISVPVHGSKELGPGLIRNIEKTTGVPLK